MRDIGIRLSSLMLLALTTRRMARSAHLALSPIHFTDQVAKILPFQIDIRTRKCILHRWAYGEMLPAQVTTSSGDMCARLAFPTTSYAYSIALRFVQNVQLTQTLFIFRAILKFIILCSAGVKSGNIQPSQIIPG